MSVLTKCQKNVVAKLVPVLSQLSSLPCVVLPPVPLGTVQSVHSRRLCCDDKSHAINAGVLGQDTAMVERLMHPRKLQRIELGFVHALKLLGAGCG